MVWRRADLPDRSDGDGSPVDLVIANEYLDALPVHRLAQGQRLQEAFVGWVDGDPDQPVILGLLDAPPAEQPPSCYDIGTGQ